LIFIDIDPHEGLLELEMYTWLKNNNYKGIIIFDDIHLGRGHMRSTANHSMQEFWDKVDPSHSYDLTNVGHWSGTGLVCFDNEKNEIILNRESNRKIPNILFQTWETKTISPEFSKIARSWIERNPNYKYVFQDAREREEFLKTNFDERVHNAYLKIRAGAFKADLWRYCILYEYGGVYADIDTLCLGNLDDFIGTANSCVFVIDLNQNSEEGTHNLANGFIAIEPRSPIMRECILRVVHNVEHGIVDKSRLLDFSGPGVLGRSVNRYLQLKEDASFVGKEGVVDNIHFLRFEQHSEFVKDVNGNCLFQNKNGNPEIVRLYEEECRRAKCVEWTFETALT
jgi:hypothetical protein